VQPRRLLFASALVVLFGGAPAFAQITEEPVAPLPDPRKFAHGIFADAEAGPTFFLGRAAHPMGVGTTVGVRVGYDLLRFVAVQAHVFGSTHRTDFAGAPQSDQILQLYVAAAELKLSVPIDRFTPFAFGGAGVARFSSNLLSTTTLLTDRDAQTMPAFTGGAGLDYHTLSRHFSFGLLGTFQRLAKLRAPGAVAATAYVRYTF
jgi:opacity protein-like surface antigen